MWWWCIHWYKQFVMGVNCKCPESLNPTFLLVEVTQTQTYNCSIFLFYQCLLLRGKTTTKVLIWHRLVFSSVCIYHLYERNIMRTGISFSSWWTMLCNIQLPVSAGVPKERGLLAEVKKVTYVHTLFEFSQKIVPALNIFSMQKSYVTNGCWVRCRTEEKKLKTWCYKKEKQKGRYSKNEWVWYKIQEKEDHRVTHFDVVMRAIGKLLFFLTAIILQKPVTIFLASAFAPTS